MDMKSNDKLLLIETKTKSRDTTEKIDAYKDLKKECWNLRKTRDIIKAWNIIEQGLSDNNGNVRNAAYYIFKIFRTVCDNFNAQESVKIFYKLYELSVNESDIKKKKNFSRCIIEMNCIMLEFIFKDIGKERDYENIINYAEKTVDRKNNHKHGKNFDLLEKLARNAMTYVYLKEKKEREKYTEIRSLIDTKRYDDAIDYAQKILRKDAKDIDALLLLAEAYFSIENYDEAKDILNSCTHIENSPEVQLLWAQMYVHKTTSDQEKFDESLIDKALTHVDEALAMDDEFFDALIMKAQLLYWKGEEYEICLDVCRGLDEKRTENFMRNCWIKDVPETHPGIKLVKTLTKIDSFMSNEKFEEAIKDIDYALTLKADQKISEVIRSMRIECLLGIKRYDDATLEIEKLIESNPNYPMSYLHKAIIAKELGEESQSLANIDICIRIAEETDMQDPQFYAFKAKILKEQNNPKYKEYEKKSREAEKKNNKKIKKYYG